MDAQRKALASFGGFLLIISLIMSASGLAIYKQGLEIERLQRAPRYFCDGSTTMGYAVPGTPEAAACWIEGGKK